MVSLGAQAWNVGLRAVPPARSRGREPLVFVPWSWKLFSYWTSNESEKFTKQTVAGKMYLLYLTAAIAWKYGFHKDN